MSNLPRLSGALRAFIGLGTYHDPSSEELSRKRQLLTKKKTEKAGSGWTRLTETIRAETSMSQDEVSEVLKELIKCAQLIVGDTAESDVAESAAVYMFEIFKSVDKVGHKETTSLRGVFGPFPASAATKACAVVNRITSGLPDDVIMLLGNEEREEADGAPAVQEFGKGIKFCFPTEEPLSDVSSSESDEENRKEVNLAYSGHAGKEKMAKKKAAPNRAEEMVGGEQLDTLWLQREVEKYYKATDTLGMSLEDLTSTIFDVLTSPKSNSELQNDLFEFLGFDRFELIQSLLENRDKLLYMTTNEPDSQALMPRPKLEGASRPAYGAQVTVQSEHEKAMLKQMRKEEKKYEKRMGRTEEGDGGNAFNPVQLRAKREAALQSAATAAPMFSGRGVATQRERYPNVYDQMEEARMSSSFIAGVKMSLPAGLERENNKTYEEVNLPHCGSAPLKVGEERVKISQLDEIAQMAFKNTKALNRIQSVVFETAYRTNENLLICAPTGAGKTNIAMLTILHELKQHISQGVIKKDEFKIIYVAPMKALAAEMVRNFGSRLEPLGISVRELTGDMSLTKAEILKTQMMVTTPEKWDVVTRKSTGDVALAQLVRLLIIDEVHLLHDDRGAVIESLVARTLRQVERSQSMIRIVGLSATLPNYLDVARFLHVNPYLGLFFFDNRFRPVPLGMTFIGIKALNRVQQMMDFNTVCYEKVLAQVRRGYQVMVFVHARNETVRTATVLRDNAKNSGDIRTFLPDSSAQYGEATKNMMKSRNKQMKELFGDGFSIHHAGMLRQDRNLVEKYFAAGHIKVLVCTATLAWGVNLPAHAVIIKGTQIYDAKKGSFVDLGILDVMQIFGRAGRPQYDTFGHGTILTTHDKLSHYLSLMTRQNPIESQFINSLVDNLNAEIALGTVNTVEEAVKWLSYSYLYVRLTCNPHFYGVPFKSIEEDPSLTQYRCDLITEAGRKLDKSRMVRFNEATGYFSSTDQGRIASHFYIKYDTVEVINEHLKTLMTEADVFALVSQAQEFDQIKVRDEEMDELERLMHETCEMQVKGGAENTHGKVNILLQSFVSRQYLDGFSLVSDQSYVAQNSARIIRALFEVCLKKGWPVMASRLLTLSKCIDKRIWNHETPLRQFSVLSHEIISKIEARRLKVSQLRDMDAKEIGHMLHHVKMGSVVKKCVHQLPQLDIDATIQPITRTVLRVRLVITPAFTWDDKVHGNSCESFWIWVEDPDTNHMYHSEYFLLQKKMMFTDEPQVLVFTIPIFEPLPSQYYVKAISDRWLGTESMCAISFQHLILPERHPPHTELLNLQPLPVTALMNPMLETLYKFTHFNPIQTQLFHVLYHTDHNVLLGAPTGSGKTIAAELAIFRLFRDYPKNKAVYIAPLKALVRERMEDWKVRIEQKLGKKVVELTGDVTPDMRAIARADLIVTTPEKWDGVSRSWQTRSYVKAVSLIVIDEIHLLGNDRGPVLEVIVSRTNFISSHTEKKVRVVGLSTALANARDLADWLGIVQVGLYNFRPSVRPVPLEVHINGFPGQHYCPRMATMNKPTFNAIKTYSPEKPVLIFVSSRRQTRLTALDLIAFLAGEDNPKQWLHMREIEVGKARPASRMFPRITVRFWLVLLTTVYFMMLFVFHGRLQIEVNQMSDAAIFQRIISSNTGTYNCSDLSMAYLNGKKDINRRMLRFSGDGKGVVGVDTTGTTPSTVPPPYYEARCFMPWSYPGRRFQSMEPNTFAYSAYLDERQRTRFIRIMTILSTDKKNRRLNFFCTFPTNEKTNVTVVGTIYELCENHGRRYGGFMVSCEVPDNTSTTCMVNVSMTIQPLNEKYIPPKTNSITVPVSLLRPKSTSNLHRSLNSVSKVSNISVNDHLFGHRKHVQFNFTVCVPPLFGRVSPLQMVEWIEVHKLLGVEHFIFYIHQDMKENKTMKVLESYKHRNIATLLEWKLPKDIGSKSVWYYGQLTAHNDCMYRAMSMTKYLAIIDIDEVIVPHGSSSSILAELNPLFEDSTCGLSLTSAFYDRQFMKKPIRSDLMTMSALARSGFSNVRKKVVVAPTMVFEVGIHHISKPAREWFKVSSVDTWRAFLHHYRRCVPNYGMKCVPKQAVNDTIMLKYNDALTSNVKKVFFDVLSEQITLTY